MLLRVLIKVNDVIVFFVFILCIFHMSLYCPFLIAPFAFLWCLLKGSTISAHWNVNSMLETQEPNTTNMLLINVSLQSTFC